ncbi:hypothetical protein E2C01_078387 [Portunus trituberculatus]|uniref:Uncharacterized protein n=1 Tax=Portunus trituberculatus TaxID=210409 RepID=A0A5B7IIL3_PORTR|nr:hypothetical protein [Portunus trituberculatus]
MTICWPIRVWQEPAVAIIGMGLVARAIKGPVSRGIVAVPALHDFRGLAPFNCPKLAAAVAPSPATPKPPQKPVALLVWPSQQGEDWLVLPASHSTVKTAAPLMSATRMDRPDPPVLSTGEVSCTPEEGPLDWCKPFLCRGTAE